MNSKKELQYAYGLAILFFVVGVLSYAAFSQKPPERPVRLMFHSIAGKVLFDHKTHLENTGYGVSCIECHHHPGEDEASSTACIDCHNPKGAEKENNETCLQCHGAEDIEDAEPPNRSDAFHSQCIGCHQEFEAGARECSSCHVM